MKLSPSAGDWSLASAVYDEFRAKPESQRIASRYALAYLAALVSQTRPARVLEIGAGIGTVTRLLLDHPAAIGEVVSTEANETCRRELAVNIEPSDRWRLCYDVDETFDGERFDLVVLDSAIKPEHCERLGEDTVFFVEGNRRPFRNVITQGLADTGRRINFEQYSPRWQLRMKPRRIWGLLPKFKLQRRKGCFIGRVAQLPL